MRRAGRNQRFWVGLFASAVVAWAGGHAMAQTVTYSLGTESDALDANFYSGGASTYDSSEPAIGVGRIILNFGVNNAGTQAIFWGIRSDNFNQGLFMVDIGDPSSWRRIHPDTPFNYDQITWVPDDSAAYIGSNKYTFASNTLADQQLSRVPTVWIQSR
jgi:hypothetical protein